MRESGRGERTGYGLVCYRAAKIIHRFSIGLGRHATVFDAEMYALSHAAMKAAEIVHAGDVNHVYFYSDSSSAVSEIVSPLLHPSQIASLIFLRHVSSILSSPSSPHVSLHWSPGHAGVVGNEAADQVAKLAIRGRALNQMTVSSIKHRANENITTRWKRWVRGLVKTEGTRFLDLYPISRTPSAFFKTTNREIFGRTSQTLTGHGYTGEYYKRMFLEESPWCLCSKSPGAPVYMTRDHILRHCSRYTSSRFDLARRIPDLMNPSWEPHLLGAPSALPALTRFLKSSGAFTKLGIPFRLNLILPPDMNNDPP